jgi:hypothetical protein
MLFESLPPTAGIVVARDAPAQEGRSCPAARAGRAVDGVHRREARRCSCSRRGVVGELVDMISLSVSTATIAVCRLAMRPLRAPRVPAVRAPGRAGGQWQRQILLAAGPLLATTRPFSSRNRSRGPTTYFRRPARPWAWGGAVSAERRHHEAAEPRVAVDAHHDARVRVRRLAPEEDQLRPRNPPPAPLAQLPDHRPRAYTRAG